MFGKKSNYWYLLFIAYIIGLLCTNIPLDQLKVNYFWQGIIFAFLLIILSQLIEFIASRYFYWRINRRWWLISVLVVIVAFYYYHWRLPTVNQTDVSRQLTPLEKPWATDVTITGKITTLPTINRSRKAKFELQASKFQAKNQKPITVTGKIYVTAPLLMTTGLYPSQTISLTGKLYKPLSQLNPGNFDFANYLALKGIFSGFSANKIEIITEGNYWQKLSLFLRQRVIKTHVSYLNTEMGTFVSAITIGNRGVDLPFPLLDSFRQISLSHVLSASGFQISLLLTAILVLTKNQSPQLKFICGITGLFIYLSLTGFYPSVLRAGLMGIAVLIAIISDRRVKISASLLLAATILLIINPLWIWDLGFQFSFLATWGLICNVSPIVKRLDWMPPNIANLIAVPLVATIWILPLQCYIFKGFSPYCILTNIIATFFVTVISLGGMITALVGIFSPMIGSYLTFLLMPFTWILIKIAEFISNLPFSWLAVGQIPLIFVLICYSFLFLLNISVWWQKRWLKFSLFLLTLIALPLIYQKLTLVQITVLQTYPQPSIVIQNYLQTGIINLNDKNNTAFTLIPFLHNQGINKINFIYSQKDANNNLSFTYFSRLFPVKKIITNNDNELKTIKEIELNKFKQQKKDILDFNFQTLNWLIINTKKTLEIPENLSTDVLIYSGNNLLLTQLQQLKPKIAIAFSNYILPEHQAFFQKNNITVFNTQTEGAIKWQPKKGFRAYGTNYDTI